MSRFVNERGEPLYDTALKQEYGYDTHNMHFYTDETLTIEVDMSEVPREDIEKVLGGVPIVRCTDCKYYFGRGMYCELDRCVCDDDFCSRGERKVEE